MHTCKHMHRHTDTHANTTHTHTHTHTCIYQTHKTTERERKRERARVRACVSHGGYTWRLHMAVTHGGYTSWTCRSGRKPVVSSGSESTRDASKMSARDVSMSNRHSSIRGPLRRVTPPSTPSSHFLLSAAPAPSLVAGARSGVRFDRSHMMVVCAKPCARRRSVTCKTDRRITLSPIARCLLFQLQSLCHLQG